MGHGSCSNPMEKVGIYLQPSLVSGSNVSCFQHFYRVVQGRPYVPYSEVGLKSGQRHTHQLSFQSFGMLIRIRSMYVQFEGWAQGFINNFMVLPSPFLFIFNIFSKLLFLFGRPARNNILVPHLRSFSGRSKKEKKMAVGFGPILLVPRLHQKEIMFSTLRVLALSGFRCQPLSLPLTSLPLGFPGDQSVREQKEKGERKTKDFFHSEFQESPFMLYLSFFYIS